MFSRRPTSSGTFGARVGSFPQLDANSINRLIDESSVAIKYWKAMSCPCTTERSGQPKVDCNECRGLGWFYQDHEHDPIYTRALVHGRRERTNQGKGGRYTTGGASFTFQRGVIPGDGDLIQVCQGVEVINDEYHTIGAKLRDGSTAETLRFRDVKCIEAVAVFLKETGKIVLLEPSKYTFNAAGRKLDFTDVEVGTQYSLRYTAAPEYVVRGDSSRPVLRVAHDDGLPDPDRTRKDIVYPYQVDAIRLDRAILSRQRGEVDFNTQSTFNNAQGRGPFR